MFHEYHAGGRMSEVGKWDPVGGPRYRPPGYDDFILGGTHNDLPCQSAIW